MGFYDMTRNALSAAREKTEELLGEEGMENLRDLGRDVVNAGRQIARVTEEVCEDCDNEVTRTARQFYGGAAEKLHAGIVETAREVRDDCDVPHAVENAREFYVGTAEKVQQGAENTVRTIQRKAEERERRRAERRAGRKMLLKHAVRILVCVVLLGVLIYSLAIRFSQRLNGPDREPTQIVETVQSARPEILQDEQPEAMTDAQAEENE